MVFSIEQRRPSANPYELKNLSFWQNVDGAIWVFETYSQRMGYDPWFPAHRFWSSVASSGRTSNQSVLSISAYETHFPTYNKTISSIPPPASSSGVGSSGDISNKQAGADNWEPRHSRSRTYQRTQSFRLHPGLVTLDTLDKEQHCCTIQWSLW